MLGRSFALVIVCLLFVASGATSAFAWANGGPTPNYYGTHDWIMDKAIKNAGSGGRWVVKSAALKATDDPDTMKTNPVLHNFREGYGARGAAEAVADLYYKAVVAYRKGDMVMASKYVGQLSHYYSDANQPFHAAYNGRYYGKLHTSYELAVDKTTKKSTDRSSWAYARTPRTVTDVRRNVVASAAYARSKYPAIRKAYAKSHSVNNRVVAANTRLVLNRSINDLADIIRSVPSGSGLATSPATFDTWLYRYYPAKGGKICVYAKCLDANGRPIEGARVRFQVGLRETTSTAYVYTGPDGVAKLWQNIGDVPTMSKRNIVVTQTTNRRTVTSNEWYMPTPLLASGRDGVSLTVDFARPAQGTDQVARVRLRSTTGKAVAGLPVKFYWYFADTTRVTTAITGATGYAVSTLNIGDAAPGTRVDMKAQVFSGGTERASTASFVPVE